MLRTLCLTLLAALALAACGGGDDDDGAGSAEGAEAAVRSYLAALVNKDGAEACRRFSPEYQRSVLRQNREFARSEGAKDCPALIEAVTNASPSVTFEGRPLRRDTIPDLEMRTVVRESGEEHNATVTGNRGVQRYELETRDGAWLIVGIERTG